MSDYSSQHREVRLARGKASEYDCVSCDHQAFQWAWIHDTDRWDVNNYNPMCCSCHLKYDGRRGGWFKKETSSSKAEHASEKIKSVGTSSL